MHPKIADLGFVTIHSYGFFISLAFTFGIILAVRRARRFGVDVTTVLDMAIIAIISAIAGSRIFYAIVNYPEFIKKPLKIFYLNEGGLVFYGGLIGVVASLSYYIIKNNLNFFMIADLLIPSLPLGHAFGRTGCFLNGCCYGGPTSSMFGIVFPNLGANSVPRHPTQLYEATFCLLSLGFLLLIERHLKKEGYLFVAYIYMYSAWRFAIEFVRADDRGVFLFGLSPSQNVSLLGFVFATAMLVTINSRARKALASNDKPANGAGS